MYAFSLKFLPDNPVLTKELRVRMRGARAYWILFGYLGFLAAVLLVSYYGFLQSVQNNGYGGSETARLGSTLFTYILVTQIFLVLFITPAITSGSITLENEQRTMEMLTMTRLSPRSIIAGKLLSAISFTTLLLVSSLPLISICFMFGSIDPAMVVSTYLLLLMGSFLIGALGLMWSSIAKSTTTAVMFTYITLFFLSIFVAFVFAMGQSSFGATDASDNVLRVLSQTWFSDRFLGLHGPTYMGFAILCCLGGLLFAAIAMTQLGTKFQRERQALLLRGLTIALAAVQIFAIDLLWLQGWYLRGAQGTQVVVSGPIAALIGAAILLMFLTPIFTTGDLASYEARQFPKYALSGWTPRGLSRAKMASGLPFMLILTMLFFALFALSFLAVGKSGDIMHSAHVAAATNPKAVSPTYTPFSSRVPVPPSGTQSVQKPPLKAFVPDAGDFPQAAVVILASVCGFSLLCIFLSIAFRSRWVAWMLATLFLLMIWILPQIAKSNWTQDSGAASYIDLFYLDPIQSIVQMAEPMDYFRGRPMTFGDMPMWQVTTVSWLLIGAGSVLLMLPFVQREKQRNTPIPYEELVANA